MEKKLEVAAHLNDTEYVQLLETYLAHNRSMDLQASDKYSLSNIIKVERGDNGNLHVHYADGEWWHYTVKHEWY